jgi:hypothetical protein
MTLMSDPRAEYRALLASGWRQGTVFAAPGVAIPYLERDDKGVWNKKGKVLKDGERLVLITQPCDLISPQETTVEALRCKLHPPDDEVCVWADGKSARIFLVDPSSAHVAYAAHRVLLKKRDLAHLQPLAWPSDEDRRRRFIHWLGSRYDRPPLPDLLHDLFEAKVNEALITLQESDPGTFRILNGACKEWRINVPDHEDPPFDTHLLLVIERQGLSQAEADAFQLILDQVHQLLDSAKIRWCDDVRILSRAQISWAEVEATARLFLEPRTYQGAEIFGAEPLRRV